jgi:hypothetical protein
MGLGTERAPVEFRGEARFLEPINFKLQSLKDAGGVAGVAFGVDRLMRPFLTRLNAPYNCHGSSLAGRDGLFLHKLGRQGLITYAPSSALELKARGATRLESAFDHAAIFEETVARTTLASEGMRPPRELAYGFVSVSGRPLFYDLYPDHRALRQGVWCFLPLGADHYHGGLRVEPRLLIYQSPGDKRRMAGTSGLERELLAFSKLFEIVEAQDQPGRFMIQVLSGVGRKDFQSRLHSRAERIMRDIYAAALAKLEAMLTQNHPLVELWLPTEFLGIKPQETAGQKPEWSLLTAFDLGGNGGAGNELSLAGLDVAYAAFFEAHADQLVP